MELEKGNYVGLALIDLSLAFDTVNCEKILPGKLKHYGATENTANFSKASSPIENCIQHGKVQILI